MNQSENINDLATSLSKAQGEMQAAIKDSINPFFKSKYADLGSVWDAARPVLSKNGLCIMQTTQMMDDKIVMVTTLAHTSGQWVKSYLPLNPSKNDSQGVGAAITYLRRYSLSALVGVVCDDEDDGETSVGRGKTLSSPAAAPLAQKPPPIKQINTNQALMLEQLEAKLPGSEKGAFAKWIKACFGSDSLNQLPESAFDKVLDGLSKKLAQMNEPKNEDN